LRQQGVLLPEICRESWSGFHRIGMSALFHLLEDGQFASRKIRN